MANTFRRRPFTKIVMIGANGFPGMVYGPMLERLCDKYDADVEVIDAYKKFVPGGNWKPMIQEVSQELRHERHGPRTLIIGHSLGAALMLAAYQSRDFGSQNGIVLIDPPVSSVRRRIAIYLTLKYKFGPFYQIIESTARKTNGWSSREEAMEFLKTTNAFAGFHPDVLEEFKVFGLGEMSDGTIRLAFPPRYESDIFRSTPQELPRFSWMRPGPTDVNLYNPSSCYMKGAWFVSDKNEFSSKRCYHEATQLWNQMNFYRIDSHMTPLIEPYKMADYIDDALNAERFRC
eukprot:TRINITY_DN5408_c0_g1_i1.p1 TRINITY_DN5408_c0_g1~~TRINITY_DN5408_c0_g1_i1.p1  ORF type:complete len:289 (+),score=33.66 TRINITY_DN5408_c0_g1_i1:40-906(+)